jgi:hypothetical protein
VKHCLTGIWIDMAHCGRHRKSKKLYRLCGAFLVVCISCCGTTIVALWTPDRIIMAADSALSDEHKMRIGSTCKIRREGDIRFATAGLFEYPMTGFSMPTIAHKAYEHTPNPKTLLKFDMIFSGEVAMALDMAKDSVSEVLARDPNLNRAEIIMIAAEDGSLKATYSQSDISGTIKTIRMNQGKGRGIAFVGEKQEIPSGRPYRMEMIVAGARNAIILYQIQHPEWRAMEPVEAARMFIELEIAENDQIVGRPISILVMERSGATSWIERGECPED